MSLSRGESRVGREPQRSPVRGKHGNSVAALRRPPFVNTLVKHVWVWKRGCFPNNHSRQGTPWTWCWTSCGDGRNELAGAEPEPAHQILLPVSGASSLLCNVTRRGPMVSGQSSMCLQWAPALPGEQGTVRGPTFPPLSTYPFFP